MGPITYQQAKQRNWRYPQLWEFCGYGMCPSLGNQASLYDLSGNGNVATLNNLTRGTCWSNVATNGLTLSGSNYYLYSNSGVLAAESAFTISVWVNPSTTSGDGMVFNTGKIYSTVNAYGYGVQLYRNGTTWRVYMHSGSDFTMNGGTATTSWTHICLTWNGSTAVLYVNGASVASMSVGLDRKSTAIFWGAEGTDYANPSVQFAGGIDDMRIYTQVVPLSIIELLASQRGIAYQQADDDAALLYTASGLLPFRRRKVLAL